MKRSLAFLLVSALLVFSLTACGCSANPQDDTSQNNSSQESSGSQSDNGNQNGNQNDSAVIGNGNGSNGGTQDNASTGDTQNPIEEGVDDIQEGVNNAMDNITGQDDSALNGVTYDQMLRNARVHDKDGDLTDHENSVTPGSSTL